MAQPARALDEPASQNSAPAAPAKSKPPIGRPFKPGQSGNPGGRPKGLASAIRDRVPAEELARHYLAIWQRDTDELKRLKIPLKEVTLAERNKAGEWLADRGYGKAPAHAPVEGGDPLERDSVETEIAGLVDELATRREAAPAGEAPAREVAARG